MRNYGLVGAKHLATAFFTTGIVPQQTTEGTHDCEFLSAVKTSITYIIYIIYIINITYMGIYKKPRPFNHIFEGDRILRA